MAGLTKGAVYAGIRGHVVAIDKATGSELWRTKLKGMDFVHVTTDGARLFASTRGEAWCLDPTTGTVLWHNPLKGLGYGIVSLLPAGGAPAPGVAEIAASVAERRRQAAASGAAAAT